MTVGAPGGTILPVGLGIGATHELKATISPTRAAGLPAIITVAELSFQGRLIASSTFKNTEIFTLVAVWYLVMCVPLILLVGRLEKKFGRK